MSKRIRFTLAFSLVCATMAVCAMPLPVALADEAPPTYLFQWGSNGPGNGEFDHPYGVAIDTLGNVYVADSLNHRVQRFTADGTYDLQWGSQGGGDGDFRSPYGIAIDADNNLYVADSGNGRIQKFSSTGAYLAQFGTPGADDGCFSTPYGVAVHSDGSVVYVADTFNNRIQKFVYNADTEEYEYQTKWGSNGTDNGDFNYPMGMAVDSGHHVYVADFNNNRIQKFESDGTWLATWGGPFAGTGDGEFYEPMSVSVDSNDDVYVSDSYRHRIQQLDSSGTFLTKWGSPGTGDGQFAYPQGIAVNDGKVYVADRDNCRVQVFEQPTTVDLDLTMGWNMVSVPVVAVDMSKDAVFPGVAAVYTWNPVTKSYSVPTTIEPEKGYWVAVTADDTITVTGEPVEDWTQDISLGWNMIGSAYGDALATSCLTTETTPDPLQRTAIYSWNPDTKSYQSISDITQGWGYWLASTADCTATLAPSEP